ncbi:MAG: hypothetical protein WCK39_11145 [Methanomassiliicoccales archaeon]
MEAALSRWSPLAKTLQTRGIHDWAVMVSCPENLRDIVQKAAERSLSNWSVPHPRNTQHRLR